MKNLKSCGMKKIMKIPKHAEKGNLYRILEFMKLDAKHEHMNFGLAIPKR